MLVLKKSKVLVFKNIQDLGLVGDGLNYITGKNENLGSIPGQVKTMLRLVTPKKSNLYYTRDITLKRVTSGEIHLRGLAPGQHSSKKTLQRWRRCVQFDRPGNRT